MNNQIKHTEGLIAASFTAMNPDGSINLEAIEKQAGFMHSQGVKGVFICGTTGEGMSLTVEERKKIAERWVEVASDNLTVIVHVGHTSLEDCKALATHAKKVKASAVGVMAPCFYKPKTVEELVLFCAEVARAAVDLPFYYYHMPSMTGVNFPMVTFLEQGKNKIPNLAGIKYTHEDLMDFQLCLNFEEDLFDILFGRDEILLCSLSLGARGAVGSTYNFAAPIYLKIIEAFDKGNLKIARNYQKKAVELIQLINRTPGSFNSVGKAIMKMLGIDCGPVRLPLTNITIKDYENLKCNLIDLNFFEDLQKKTTHELPKLAVKN